MKNPKKRYEMIWRNKWLTAEAHTVEEMAAMLLEAADTLMVMAQSGVNLDPESCADDYALLWCEDEKVAEAWGFDEVDEEGLGDTGCENCRDKEPPQNLN